MRRPNASSASNILLLVVYCIWCHVQPIAGGKCSGQWAIHACAGGNGKRSDIDESAQVTNLERDGQGPDLQEARGGGGGRESAREGDEDLRSEVNDRRHPPLEEAALFDLGNRRPPPPPAFRVPLDSALGRLRSLLRETETLDGDDRTVEKQWQQDEEQEPPRRSRTDTDRRYINKDTLTMIRRILDDIERRFDSRPLPDSVNRKQGYARLEDNDYSLQKRAAEQ